jgi:hypothetical protein
MTQHAQLVLDLIDRVRGAKSGAPKQEDWDWAGSDDKRARLNDPGYPSEEVTTVALQSPTRGLSGGGSYVYDDIDPEVRSEAERDMMTIRSKRSAAAAVAANAASNANGSGGTMSSVMGAGGEKLIKKSRKRGVSDECWVFISHTSNRTRTRGLLSRESAIPVISARPRNGGEDPMALERFAMLADSVCAHHITFNRIT